MYGEQECVSMIKKISFLKIHTSVTKTHQPTVSPLREARRAPSPRWPESVRQVEAKAENSRPDMGCMARPIPSFSCPLTFTSKIKLQQQQQQNSCTHITIYPTHQEYTNRMLTHHSPWSLQIFIPRTHAKDICK